SRATPSPNRTACLPRDDGRGSSAKSPIATPAYDNLRFGLSRIDSDISAHGNPKSPVTDRRTERPWPAIPAVGRIVEVLVAAGRPAGWGRLRLGLQEFHGDLLDEPRIARQG